MIAGPTPARTCCLAATVLALLLPLASFSADSRGLKTLDVTVLHSSVPRYHALIIGIDDYVHWPDLRQAKDDTLELAETLKTDYGFTNVVLLNDKQATLDNIQHELREFVKSLNRDDALLIYFAGHGYYDKLLKKGYWVPADARQEIKDEPATSEWLHNTTLKEHVDAMKARHVLIVSDTCFSGSLFRGGMVELAEKQNAWYRQAISQPSRWCIASGDMETVPDESIFAKKFLQVLEYPRQNIFSASDVAGWIKTEVSALSGNQPIFGPLQTASDSELGEFVFLYQSKKESEPVPVATTTTTTSTSTTTTTTPPPPTPVVRSPEPVSPPLPRTAVRHDGQTWHIGPRIGASTCTGVAGLELQWHHLAGDIGYIPGWTLVAGLKYYLAENTDSWFAAFTLGFRETDIELFDNPNRDDSLVGGLAGYRWFWSNGWNLTCGAGAGALSKFVSPDGDTETSVAMVWDLSLGYSF